jgi:TolA-binding protein
MKADLLIATGVTYEAEGKFGAAERAYRSAAKAVPGSARAAGARMSIVQIYLDRNQLREAVKELVKVAKDFPGTGQAAQAQYMAGSTYETLGDRKKAEEAYRNVLGIAPQSPWAFEAQQALVRLMERSQ